MSRDSRDISHQISVPSNVIDISYVLSFTGSNFAQSTFSKKTLVPWTRCIYQY